jgi:chromosome segregation protein
MVPSCLCHTGVEECTAHTAREGFAAMTDATRYRAPRLTRLEIQGFKSFLQRTVFAFEPGITGVVGPNGSGKSNVADALRWVLGEQGQQALRAKKTEDVIFSGGQGRAPAGMAEATLTFDNAEGWLPTEFAEVSVTRRAFRSGENQYLINGRKVRLKDVALLTAGLGQSHVVVGQGLVDAALSLRAEERRGLFEHAADLSGLRLKVAEAERNLAETDANTTRLNDILVEIEPRLRSLERAARQAREWQGLRDRLYALQGAHYRAALEAAIGQEAAARDVAAQADGAAVSARAEVDRLDAASEQATARLASAREKLRHHDEQKRGIEDRLRRLTHERDLAAARADALARRHADMDDARESLDARVVGVAADLERVTAELRELERITSESREAAARFGRETSGRKQARATVESRLAAATRELAEGERKEADLLRRRAVLAEREAALLAEQERLQAAAKERAGRIATLRSDAEAATAAATRDDEQRQALDEEHADVTETLAEAAARSAAARDEVERLQRALGEASTRLDVLRRLHESGAGLHGGVREVVTAGRAGRLDGILGTIAELVEAPKRVEVAIEVALGGRLQDIVVDTWAHAEAAIAHLKRTGAGRATFQPLDTVRAGRANQAPAEIARLPGVQGVAADLVSAAAPLDAVVMALLGRTLVVEDLATTREALRHLGSGWSVVTLAGEIARSGGSVTGGSAARESGTLARERELRELPDAVARFEEARAVALAAEAEAGAEVAAVQERQRRLEGERVALRAAVEERRQQGARLAGWLAELDREQERAEARRREIADDHQRLIEAQEEVDREAERLAASRAAAAQSREEADAELADLSAVTAEMERAAADEGRRLAGLEERLRGERRREAGLRAQERALAEELALRAERMALLDRERETLAADHDRLSRDVEAGTRDLAAAVEGREPLRMEAMGAEIAQKRVAEAQHAARATLGECERGRDHAGFALERATQELSLLRQRITDDLDLADPAAVLVVESAHAGMAPEAREAEIGRLRERLRRVGYVGDDAVAEYERERSQQAFLREQLADVQGAAAALRELLAELRQTMRARFDETFARVAEEFAQAFATLFGGGTAQLVLSSSDQGGEPGIEIIAQPPGKRLQNLALLSGGERALTAAALLFAILKVNPVPFCLLDEVDAALDEANVVRFRERLQALALQTQIIVVTHNRGTIEIADTLYGVSMGADGVSQVLSLRMSESLPAD